MGSFSLVHWVILLVIVVLIFGAGRLPNVMGDFAKGIKAFKAGMKDDDPPASVSHAAPVPPPSSEAVRKVPNDGNIG